MHKKSTINEHFGGLSTASKNFKTLSLSQLSISEIKEQRFPHDSLDMQDENDFIG